MTLLEVMIVLAIIGLVSAAGVRGFRNVTRSELRGQAMKLAGAMKYLFDRASTTGRTHRLVIDMNTGKYWAEVTDERVFMPREKETDESRARENEAIAKEQEDERKATEESSELDAYDISRYQPKDFVPKRAKFEGFKDAALRQVSMKGAVVASVYTPRLYEPATSGQAYVYFFPLGQTEAALIHVSDKAKQTYYTLVVHPLTGRVKIYPEYLEPRLDERFDDEGTRVEQ